MSRHHDDLTSVPDADLTGVTGGAGLDLTSMLPMLMMRRRASAAEPPPAPAPAWKPKIMVDGVEQALTDKGNGTYGVTTGDTE